ncbi:MAG: GNAT family N-acetyltransferase [Thiotrichales bacterium]
MHTYPETLKALLIVTGEKVASDVQWLVRRLRKQPDHSFDVVEYAMPGTAEPSIITRIERCVQRGVTELVVLPYAFRDHPEGLSALRATIEFLCTQYAEVGFSLAPDADNTDAIQALIRENSNNMGDLIRLNQISLHPAPSAGLDAVAGFVHARWSQTYASQLPPALVQRQDRAAWRDHLRESHQRGWVARLGERIIGYADRSLNNVDNLWIDPGYRGRGIGSRLLDRVCGDIQTKTFAYAQMGVEAADRMTSGFLQHRGWRRIGEETLQLAPDTAVQVLVFACELKRPSPIRTSIG